MTGFKKGRAVSQVDKILINGHEVERDDLLKMIEKCPEILEEKKCKTKKRRRS